MVHFYSTEPLPVDDLEEDAGSVTTSSVTATWTRPNGTEVDSYLATCSDGTPNEVIIQEDSQSSLYTAECSGLVTAGRNYTITVTTQSNGKDSEPTSVIITACEYLQVLSYFLTTRNVILISFILCMTTKC